MAINYPKEKISVDITTGGAEWAWLPVDVVGSILERTESFYDYVRFAAVCKPWLSVARDQYYYKKRLESKSSNSQLPLLLIPANNDDEEEDEETMSRRLLHTVIGWKTLETKLRVPYGGRRCCGSSHGWLIFADDHNVTLFNPFTAQTMLLPPIKINDDDAMAPDCEKQYHVKKVVLSKDPCLSPHDYEVVALYEYMGNIAFFKSGTAGWVYPTRQHFSNVIPRLLFDDIIYFNGIFYVLSQKLLACLDQVTMQLKRVKIRDSEKDIRCYMVESCLTRHLLYIERYPICHAKYNQDYAHTYPPDHPIRTENGYFKIDESVREYDPDCNRLTNYFLVYKVIMENNNVDGQDNVVEYVQVKDLGDEALFIGHNDAVSVLASNFPGCEPNTIYYTDEFWYGLGGRPYMPCGPIDMGFFSLSDSHVPEAKRRYMLHNLKSKDLPPPIWTVPKPKLL